ncbi:uncharacterized protein [Chelonus insularis]|uniref:uncharacterized protein n=1 Tax=Chelonus insularis TaxID=460826 RepID=UPI0015885A60|nr:uncharacterized protein LOC118064300 [Chelonus insularis]
MVKISLTYGIQIADDPKFLKITVLAVRKNKQEIVSIFLEHGVKVLDVNSEGKTLPHHCVSSSSDKSRYKKAEMLFNRGAAIYVHIPNSSLFFDEMENDHHDIARLLLRNHGDVHYINSDGNILLHMAIANIRIDFIETLLREGGNPKATNKQGKHLFTLFVSPMTINSIFV